MISRLSILLMILYCATHSFAQQITVADAVTSEALPFATVKHGDAKQGIITDINGRFTLPANAKQLVVSYIGHQAKTVSSPFNDTIFLDGQSGNMSEVVIKPPYDKIKAIVNNAVRAKPTHNPDNNEFYNCAVYYKMLVDLVPNKETYKTAEQKRDLENFEKFTNRSHIIFAETYSKRYYRKPAKVQEYVEASRFSGFEKTHFTNLITNILPFHVYEDYIKLNEKDYLHPIAAGWQQRYEFDLLDEVPDGNDTIYILKYRPKNNATFEALWGTVYIHNNSFAISHIIVNTTNPTDTTASRYVKMEQIYMPVDGKWFPQELNYELVFKEYPSKNTGMLWKGHCMVDHVSFGSNSHIKFDKAHSVILSDSVDMRRDEWNKFRFDSLDAKEQNTYTLIDSISKEAGVEKIINGFRNVGTGRVSLGYVDLELKRLLSYNTYEGTRVGLGLFTNDKISKYVTLGGWFGYGVKDKKWKYGGSVRFLPGGQKDNWIELAYQNNYKSTGSINFHKELDRNGLKQFTLAQVDRIKEISAMVHKRAGYWELELSGLTQELEPQYAYTFTEAGTNGRIFDVNELSVGIRYAYGEVRTPAFGQYIPTRTKYPVVYLKVSGGTLGSGSYETKYTRALAAVTYNVHINRWGRDNYRLEGGVIQDMDNHALPRSLLLAGNGFRMSEDYQWYTNTGFLTMFPFEYFSDMYVSLLYRHDFDRAFFHIKNISKPSLSIAHNMLYGHILQGASLAKNPGIQTPSAGYHESGLILNKLLYYNFFKLANLNLNVGGFYHWSSEAFSWDKYGRLTIGVTFDI